MKRIKVSLEKYSSLSYEICIGRHVLDRIGLIMAKENLARHYIVISDSNVMPLHGEKFTATLRNMDLAVDAIEFTAGESSKNIETVLSVVNELIRCGADRSTALVALGGGVTGDLVGFVSSIYMRSIPYIQIPTSLIAQVDSSIGGKTGIDLPAGKNLLGTFFQPKMVFVDLEFLDTLPVEEFDNGLAEIVKYGIIEDTELFTILEGDTEALKQRDADLIEMIVERSCTIKKGIVEIDEKDTGIRRILNFGHTVGHAIEAASEYAIPHGHAVSIGMVASARISEKMGHLRTDDRKRIEHLIAKTGLPDSIPQSVGTNEILSRIQTDKKKRGGSLNFVLLKKLGLPFINGSVEERLIHETIEEMRK